MIISITSGIIALNFYTIKLNDSMSSSGFLFLLLLNRNYARKLSLKLNWNENATYQNTQKNVLIKLGFKIWNLHSLLANYLLDPYFESYFEFNSTHFSTWIDLFFWSVGLMWRLSQHNKIGVKSFPVIY